MTSPNNSERLLHSLSEKISQAESLQSEYARELEGYSNALSQLESRYKYYRLISWFRSPSEMYNLWPVGVVICGPLIVFALFFVVTLTATNSSSLSLRIGGSGAILSTGVFLGLLYLPNKESLRNSLSSIQAHLVKDRKVVGSLRDEFDKVSNSLNSFRKSRYELVSSIQFKREQLLKLNWKAMRGYELEKYLAAVFSSLGYTVEETGKSGDQGVDLVVQRNGLRTAIQVKGYLNNVSNDAVQQVVAGMKIYSCRNCAVITNSKFTSSAIELATANRCRLIDEVSFENFVLGRVKLV